MKLFLLSVAFIVANLLNAQTKVIAYKSHSANKKHFNETVLKDRFDVNDSNLGIVIIKELVKIDSVVINNKNAIFTFQIENLITRKDTIFITEPIKVNDLINQFVLEHKSKYRSPHIKVILETKDAVLLEFDAKTKKLKQITSESVVPTSNNGALKNKQKDKKSTFLNSEPAKANQGNPQIIEEQFQVNSKSSIAIQTNKNDSFFTKSASNINTIVYSAAFLSVAIGYFGVKRKK